MPIALQPAVRLLLRTAFGESAVTLAGLGAPLGFFLDPVAGEIPLIGGDNNWWNHEVREALRRWRWRIEGTRCKTATDDAPARQNITVLRLADVDSYCTRFLCGVRGLLLI